MSDIRVQVASDESVCEEQTLPSGVRFPKWALLVSAVFAIAIAIVQYTAENWDRATANIVSLILLSIVIGSPIFWFTFVAPFHWRIRLIPVCSIAIATVLFFQFYEIRFTGSLALLIEPRGTKDRDKELLELLPGVNTTIDLEQHTPVDFPQFLGPNRNQTVQGVRLARNWESTPPKLLWKVECGKGWSSFSTSNGYCLDDGTAGPARTSDMLRSGHWQTAELAWHQSKTRNIIGRCWTA